MTSIGTAVKMVIVLFTVMYLDLEEHIFMHEPSIIFPTSHFPKIIIMKMGTLSL